MPLSYSGDFRIDALIAPAGVFNWNFNVGPRALLYTFDPLGAEQAYVTVQAFNAAQRTVTVDLLAYVTSVTGITFLEVATDDEADIQFANANIANPRFAGETWSYPADAYVYLDSSDAWGAYTQDPQPGSAGYELFLHEVGHALGLIHPFEGTYPLPAGLGLDTKDNTLMSYVGAPFVKSAFQAYDLLALYWLYGGDGLGGERGFNTLDGPTLPPGTGLALAGGTGADTLSGSPLDDVLFGGPGSDVLTGGAGSNLVDGGEGADTAFYPEFIASYAMEVASLGDAGGGFIQRVVTVRGNGEVDLLTDVERVRFQDMGIAFDLSVLDSAGQAALLVGALGGKDALAIYKPLLGAVMQLIDAGVSPQELSAAAMRLPIWQEFAGGTSNAAIAAYLLVTVNGTEPDREALRVAALAIGTHAPGAFLYDLAISPQNQTQIDLLGLTETGLQYL